MAAAPSWSRDHEGEQPTRLSHPAARQAVGSRGHHFHHRHRAHHRRRHHNHCIHHRRRRHRRPRGRRRPLRPLSHGLHALFTIINSNVKAASCPNNFNFFSVHISSIHQLGYCNLNSYKQQTKLHLFLKFGEKSSNAAPLLP